MKVSFPIKFFFAVTFFLGVTTDLCAQNRIRITNRSDGSYLIVKTKKIESIVTIDGRFLDGDIQIKGQMLAVGEEQIAIEDIGILEIQKGGAKKVLLFPLKAVTAVAGVTGLILGATWVDSDQEEGDAALAVASVSLLAISGGSALLAKRLQPNRASKIRSFHVKDWEFSWD